LTAIIVGVLAVIGLFVGGWQGGWWLQNSAVNHNAHINSSSYGAQQSDLQTMDDDMQAIQGDQHDLLTAPSGDAQTIRTEILGTANQLCLYATYLTGSVNESPDLSQFVKANCIAGAVSATSTLRNGT
jgi:hypothetical protein